MRLRLFCVYGVGTKQSLKRKLQHQHICTLLSWKKSQRREQLCRFPLSPLDACIVACLTFFYRYRITFFMAEQNRDLPSHLSTVHPFLSYRPCLVKILGVDALRARLPVPPLKAFIAHTTVSIPVPKPKPRCIDDKYLSWGKRRYGSHPAVSCCHVP